MRNIFGEIESNYKTRIITIAVIVALAIGASYFMDGWAWNTLFGIDSDKAIILKGTSNPLGSYFISMLVFIGIYTLWVVGGNMLLATLSLLIPDIVLEHNKKTSPEKRVLVPFKNEVINYYNLSNQKVYRPTERDFERAYLN